MAEDTTKPSSDSPSFFRSGVREPVVPTPGLEPGKIVGDFELRSLLGQGGMGQVWEARQLSLSRQRIGDPSWRFHRRLGVQRS
jgi:hypothetical protein